jgi:hypothetical protein
MPSRRRLSFGRSLRASSSIDLRGTEAVAKARSLDILPHRN